MQNKVVSALTDRIAEAMEAPVDNFETFQVLRYLKGQQYVNHHDSNDEDVLDLAGPRVFTFFLYLSDVEEGGNGIMQHPFALLTRSTRRDRVPLAEVKSEA